MHSPDMHMCMCGGNRVHQELISRRYFLKMQLDLKLACFRTFIRCLFHNEQSLAPPDGGFKLPVSPGTTVSLVPVFPGHNQPTTQDSMSFHACAVSSWEAPPSLSDWEACL